MQRGCFAVVLVLVAAVSGCREREPDAPDVTGTIAIPTHTEPQVTIAVVPEHPTARSSPNVRVQIAAASDGPAQLEPIAGTTVHLVAVNRDLSWYEHLHPRADGEAWTTAITFPRDDEYILHAIVRPVNFRQLVRKQTIRVGSSAASAPRQQLAISSHEQRSGAYTIRLRTDPYPPAAGIWNSLVFDISRDGEPVTNLTPTGTLGHMVILREGGEDFVYAHSTDGEALSGIRARAHVPATPNAPESSHRGHVGDTGPEVTFHAQFPRPGLYKVWVEFLAGGEPVRADFVLDVSQPKPVPHRD